MKYNAAAAKKVRKNFYLGLAMGVLATGGGQAQDGGLRAKALVWLDFEGAETNLVLHGPGQAKGEFGGALEFTSPLQWADYGISNKFANLREMTIGGWFFLKRSGEQYFLSRGLPSEGPNAERMFRPEKEWVNFVLGTDQRGFLLGTVNGNGYMPFPYVTLEEPGIDEWHQLAVAKDSAGHHHFYHNGALVHSSSDRMASGVVHSFKDDGAGEPIRLSMPYGGMIGEAWVLGSGVSPEEIQQDFEAKKAKYKPALQKPATLLREMNAHYSTGLWREAPSGENWPAKRKEIKAAVLKILGPFPKEKVALDPRIEKEEDMGSYVRRKISIQVQPQDRMPAYLLVPKKMKGRVPAVICFYGTTSGAGKDTTVGISGREKGSKPHVNMSFAIDLAEAGFVAFAADYLRDGERVKEGRRPYNTTDFYKEYPEWSLVGKDVWDNQRAVDYLQSLEFVDPEKIGMTGHSYGGHTTIFTTALEPRIKVAIANGPVSDFLHHGIHWGVPKGAGNSQSLPNLRPYVIDHTIPLPLTFYEFTALIAPRPFLNGQAVGERRPMEEENYAAVKQVYDALGVPGRVRYHWYAGDHDYPPEARRAMVEWFKRWFDSAPQRL